VGLPEHVNGQEKQEKAKKSRCKTQDNRGEERKRGKGD